MIVLVVSLAPGSTPNTLKLMSQNPGKTFVVKPNVLNVLPKTPMKQLNHFVTIILHPELPGTQIGRQCVAMHRVAVRRRRSISGLC